MKSKFLTKWKKSKQPRKQRKYLANAPLHLRKKFVNVNLSKELRKKQNKRNMQIKKGDKVKIMRGGFKGKVGKILEVNLKKSKVIVEGIQVKKRDGSKANIKLQPSNLQIIELAERIKKVQAETTEAKTGNFSNHSSSGKSQMKAKTEKKTKNEKTDSEVKK